MTTGFNKLREYHQRRSSKELKASKLELKNLESQMKEDVISLCKCIEEGSSQKAHVFSEKTQNDLLKLRPKMEQIALDIGTPFPKIVHSFLESIQKVVVTESSHTPSPFYAWVDQDKIQSCHVEIQRLEKALRNRGV